MKTLSAKGITKTFGARRVVDDVKLEINKGEVTGLLGPNGAGKTTIFYIIIGLIRPDDGRVFLDNDDITDQPMYIRARKGINYLPQESSIFRKLTVEENILAILETLKLSKEERKERLSNLLGELNIKYIAKNKAYTLSGGERRRVEIARSLVTSPSFILLDEPFAGIDPIAVIDIQSNIMQLKSKGIGVIISDHNVRETLGVCDKAYIIDKGAIIEVGDPKQIANSKKAREIYLGENFS
jgi:lipopolysaccharide export system ATP-binding protein